MLKTSTEVLPNFLIIGAAKSGTTSLHRYLDAHPEISMSEPKEPRIFADADWERKVGAYGAMIASPEAPVRGESSTLYTRYPVAEGVPERVAARCPDARFVYLVRDPVDRVLANWVQRRENGAEHRPLAAALADLERPENHYVAASRYATQLEQWLRWFDRERILVVDQVELRRERQRTLLGVLEFLGVRPEVPANAATEFNATEAKQAMTPAASRRWLALRPLTRRLPAAAREGLARSPLFPVGRIEPPVLDGALRARLVAELSGEAERFRQLTGMAFPSWSL